LPSASDSARSSSSSFSRSSLDRNPQRSVPQYIYIYYTHTHTHSHTHTHTHTHTHSHTLTHTHTQTHCMNTIQRHYRDELFRMIYLRDATALASLFLCSSARCSALSAVVFSADASPCMFVCIHVYKCIYVYVYVYMYVYIGLYVCVCMHTYTYSTVHICSEPYRYLSIYNIYTYIYMNIHV
jgi:hypothetical protein